MINIGTQGKCVGLGQGVITKIEIGAVTYGFKDRYGADWTVNQCDFTPDEDDPIDVRGIRQVIVPPAPAGDPVFHPSHYTAHPSGVECITITEHMSFLLGNVMKYVWRADLKNGTEDLRKALWYLNREIQKREKAAK